MCCFSQPVEFVSNTQIFARAADEGRQYLVYSMSLGAKSDLAMVLPLPVPKRSADDAVRFINLEEYAGFFEDLNRGYPPPRAAGRAEDPNLQVDTIQIVDVGSFEASFVPTVADFARLDARMRLPADVWKKLPDYADYGFAVFQLRKGEQKVHPMAFEFPTSMPEAIFFPTVHIHDGEIHDEADFDHVLYCQFTQPDMQRLMDWAESDRPCGMFMDLEKCQGLIDGDSHCYRRKLHGQLANQDTLA